MTHITLKVQISLGTGIETASIEAVELANRLNVLIEFDFNTVKCIALPDGDPNNLVFNFHERLKDKSKYPIATTHKK